MKDEALEEGDYLVFKKKLFGIRVNWNLQKTDQLGSTICIAHWIKIVGWFCMVND